MTRKQRVTRAVYAVYVVLVAAFVVSSTVQVAIVVFGTPESVPTVGPDCGEALNQEIRVIEAARLAASTENSGNAAQARYARERRPAERMPAVERACSSEPHKTEALVALAQLDRAAEAHAFREASELSPVRMGAQSFISGHPR